MEWTAWEFEEEKLWIISRRVTDKSEDNQEEHQDDHQDRQEVDDVRDLE